MGTTHLLYLHGFRSSPLSTKSQKTAAWMREHAPQLTWSCPQLPASPREAIALCDGILSGWPHAGRAVVGSSLGGFYATVLAERHGCPAVLLNPAVNPARDLAAAVGETNEWHSGEPMVFRAEYLDELRALMPAAITRPERYFAVVAKGDEVLDWREMVERYRGCRIKLLEGSDHALSDYDAHVGEVAGFLGLAAG